MSMKHILFAWLGRTDLNAVTRSGEIGLGPIAQALDVRNFDQAVLLNNFPEEEASAYQRWIAEKYSTPVQIININLSSPTNFAEIYTAVIQTVDAILEHASSERSLTFHLSPGTPAMAAVWIILAKTKYPAELLESSREQGVRTVSFPFDLSAEFFPDQIKKYDDRLKELSAALPPEAPEFEDIIHRSAAMKRIIAKARLAAPRNVPVLIEGESGTGKELLARAIHDASPRKDKPFVVINCGAIPSELVESEFFGHEKGAFTGATTARIGYFEAAHTGTIFLDEIGELPREMQVKLLRTVQEGEVKRIGATTPRKVDVRIIAATNRNLIDEVAAGSFREDLFYRIAVAVIKLPPLREREGDVNLLIDNFLNLINQQGRNESNYKQKNISVSARNILLSHSWPGNVRELQNTLARAAVWSLDEKLGEEDIREALLLVPAASKAREKILNQSLDQGIDLPEIMRTVAVHYLERALEKNNGNKTNTAKTLGLPSYQTLTNWLKRYGIE